MNRMKQLVALASVGLVSAAIAVALEIGRAHV